MMINNIFYYITGKLSRKLFLCLAFFLCACTKNVLNKEPLDRFSEASVWGDGVLIETYVNHVYRIMPNGHYLSESYRNIFSALSDEGLLRNSNPFNIINAGNLTPSNLGPLDYWTTDQKSGISGQVGNPKSFYSVITEANLFFRNITESLIDQTLKDRMIGEMKVLRAYAYFQLISIYGGVPLITKPFELKDDFNVPRNTYDECMDFIIKELDEASNLLPLNYNAANKGRITKGTALAVKSRALLYAASPLNNPGNAKEKWQKAADAAKAVIDLNLYSLYSDYKTLFLQSAAYNSEVIWARPYNYVVDPEGLNVELSQYPNGFGGQGWINPLQNLVDEYETVNGLLPKNDPSYNPQNPYVNRDPRFYATILYDGAPFKGRAVETFLPK
jgi:hypothetical protein